MQSLFDRLEEECSICISNDTAERFVIVPDALMLEVLLFIKQKSER